MASHNKVYDAMMLLFSLAMVGAASTKFTFPVCKPALVQFLEAIGSELQLNTEAKSLCKVVSSLPNKSLPWLVGPLTQFKDEGTTTFSRCYTSKYRLTLDLSSDGDLSVEGSATTQEWNEQCKSNASSWLVVTSKTNPKDIFPLVPWDSIRSPGLKQLFKKVLADLHALLVDPEARVHINLDLREARATADQAQSAHDAGILGIAEWDALQAWMGNVNYSEETFIVLKAKVAAIEKVRRGDDGVLQVTNVAIKLKEEEGFATPLVLVRGMGNAHTNMDSTRVQETKQEGQFLKRALNEAKNQASVAEKALSDKKSSEEYETFIAEKEEKRFEGAVAAALERLKSRERLSAADVGE